MAVAGAAAVAYWAATALAVAGTAYSAYNARQMGKAQAAQANENAKMAESQGRVEAERIRELGKKQASAARAKMAAQGLDLNAENTVTEEIEEDIDLNTSKDAWTTFFNRKNQAGQFRTDAANYRLQAHQATVSGVLNTGSTLLSAFGNAPKGGGRTTTQPISNINSNQLTMDTTRLSSSGWA
ncbi:hypothetical protein FHP22_15640 (plasmid) [Acinetobacter indicus]|uniref:hypothetical protein n=1 Tax=Acinetobacter TaxID=469 RepID=UPI0012662901|nr:MULTISPECIES: hypothetical protein [Acinetobacter]QFS18877.1 hypothetical protein FHP22_15640 [Acinetobacter indicus]